MPRLGGTRRSLCGDRARRPGHLSRPRRGPSAAVYVPRKIARRLPLSRPHSARSGRSPSPCQKLHGQQQLETSSRGLLFFRIHSLMFSGSLGVVRGGGIALARFCCWGNFLSERAVSRHRYCRVPVGRARFPSVTGKGGSSSLLRILRNGTKATKWRTC